MRTTINIDNTVYEQAIRATGISEKTKLIHMGLQMLIEKAARERLAKLYGSSRAAHAPKRRRFT